MMTKSEVFITSISCIRSKQKVDSYLYRNVQIDRIFSELLMIPMYMYMMLPIQFVLGQMYPSVLYSCCLPPGSLGLACSL